jgi:ribA/ribD-fused uncharacterized protein
LSNFFPASVNYGKYIFPSIENAYQFAKVPKDRITDEVVAKFKLATPAKSKAYGKLLRDKGMVRPDWDQIREQVMLYLLMRKFEIPELRAKLLQTGNAELIEGNLHHDNDWGDCQCTVAKPDERRYGQKQGCHMRGKNKLGKLLMAVRTGLFQADPFRCPLCGTAENLAQMDLVPGMALGYFENGVFVFAGETKMDWNRQGPEHCPPQYFCYACQEPFVVTPPAAPETAVA